MYRERPETHWEHKVDPIGSCDFRKSALQHKHMGENERESRIENHPNAMFPILRHLLIKFWERLPLLGKASPDPRLETQSKWQVKKRSISTL